MVEKRLLHAGRLRRLPASYSWVDHRLMRGGFLQELSIEEIGLYFFLVLVGDNQGLSYYGDKTVCTSLSIEYEDLYQARIQLVRHDLIAYAPPLYQVLELPASPIQQYTPSRHGAAALGEILNTLAHKGA